MICGSRVVKPTAPSLLFQPSSSLLLDRRAEKAKNGRFDSAHIQPSASAASVPLSNNSMHGFLSALRVGLISSPLPKRKGASRVPPPPLLSKMEGGSAGSHGGAPCHALPVATLACPPPFRPSLYSIRPLQSRRRLPFVNWSFASSPADGRAMQCRDAIAIRPPSSPSRRPWPCQTTAVRAITVQNVPTGWLAAASTVRALSAAPVSASKGERKGRRKGRVCSRV